MPDDGAKNLTDDDENEYAAQADAEKAEQRRGSKPAGANSGRDSADKADAAERGSGGIRR